MKHSFIKTLITNFLIFHIIPLFFTLSTIKLEGVHPNFFWDYFLVYFLFYGGGVVGFVFSLGILTLNAMLFGIFVVLLLNFLIVFLYTYFIKFKKKKKYYLLSFVISLSISIVGAMFLSQFGLGR